MFRLSSFQIKHVTKNIYFVKSDIWIEQEEIAHNVDVAIQNIQFWKEHIARTVHQDTAKKIILEEMRRNQELIIIDWAMKFLPVSYRETVRMVWKERAPRACLCCNSQETCDEEFEVCVFLLVALRRRTYFSSFFKISLTIIYTVSVVWHMIGLANMSTFPFLSNLF